MERRFLRFAWSGFLGALLAFGALGCLISGFDLALTGGALAGFCLVASFLLSAALSFRWGLVGILAAMAGGALWLWQQGLAAQQLRNLLYYVTKLYSDAYGWRYVVPGDALGIALPVWVVAFCILFFVNLGIHRRGGTVPALLLSLVPFGACFVAPGTEPEPGFLFAFLLAVGLMACTGHRQVRADAPRLGLGLLLPLGLLLGVLFLCFPQGSYVNRAEKMQNGLLSALRQLPGVVENAAGRLQLDLGGSARQEVDLASLGPNPGYSYPVMSVSGNVSGSLYLRGRDYNVYTGTGWEATRHRAEAFGVEGEAIGTITLRTHSPQDTLFLPYYPSWQVNLAGGKAANTEGLTEYAFDVAALPDRQEVPQGPELVFGVGTAEVLSGDYITLPEDTKTWAREFREARELKTPGEIAAFLRNCAEYDLKTQAMPSEETDFVRWFVEQGETGYCVHFASAATVLLRSAGYPARYVSGYLAEAKAGKTVTVTARDAHAWAEYYDGARGIWVVLEATPASAGSEEETHPQEPEIRPVKPQEKPEPDTGSAAWWALAIIALLALLCQRHVRLYFRQQRWNRGKGNRLALDRYAQLQQLSKAAGRSLPEEAVALAEKAGFSQHILTEEELQVFDGIRRRLIADLKAKPWYLRLLHRFVFALY